MKLKSLIPSLAILFLAASASHAATLADWTFESSEPTTAGPVSPETGSGSASGHHAGAAVYSSPAGNGSSHSYSSTLWATGDYWQFQVSTIGAQNIVLTFDSVSSSTGPRDFQLYYSTDGTTFTAFGSVYTNGNSPSWSTTTYAPQYSHTNNLSAVTALNNAAAVYFRLVVADNTSSGGSTIGTGGTSRVDNFNVTAATGTPPTISSVTPSSLTTNAGTTASFTATVSAGDTPLTYFWYTNSVSPANLISATTSLLTANTLLLPNVLAANSGNYFVVVSNATGNNAVSSPAVTLTVTDPAINYQPVSQTGLPGGTIQFNVLAGGTGLSYQWYYCASASDNTQIASALGATLPGGSIVSGATSNKLTISNLQAADATNFVVVVTGTYGPVTSSVASFTVGTTQVPLAFWNFDNPFMSVSNPAPYLGLGTTSTTNVTPLIQPTGNADPLDSTTPNFAWGTENYPAQGTLNTNAGVQFNVNTAGAKNITVSYAIRCTGTASEYQQLQYTTNGADFMNYPLSSSVTTIGTAASGYLTFNYDLTGFPGAANNPHFGLRVVSEFQSTASYGTTNDAQYVPVGTTASYGTAGTLSYDLVTIKGDAITNANQPPTNGPLSNLTFDDGYFATNFFTVGDDTTPAGLLNVTATALDPNVSLNLTTVNNNGAAQVIVSSSLGNLTPVVTPVLVTVTDTNGDSTAGWFYATINPGNEPPTIGELASTNMLVNGTLTIPFTLGDDHTDMTTATPTVTSGNLTLLPNGGLSLGGSGTNRTLTITPATGQTGSAPITVSVSDGSLNTSVSIYVQVRQNTNIILVDNFDYDADGAIDTESGGLWTGYSGKLNQMVAGSGVVTVDGVDNTEDVEAGLIGAPYPTNSTTVLYSKFYVNFSTLPGTAGSYFAYFTDGSSSNFICRVWAFTNGAASGSYRIGITTTTNLSTLAAEFPQDLSLNTSYLVVSRYVLSNSTCTVWVNPVSEASPSVTATDNDTTSATQISDYDLRESTADEGILTVSNLAVGTTFNDVVGVSPADVSVVLAGATNVFAGQNFIYTLTVSNAGPSTAGGVVATDSLPAGVTFVSATGGGANTGGVVSWSVGTLATGAASSVTVTVTAPASGSLTNTASVGSTTADSNLANNTSAKVITVVAPIPLQMITLSGIGQPVINWAVEPNVSYSVLWSTNVAGPYTTIASGLTFGGTSGTFTDTVHTNLPTSFYRISSP